MDENPLLGLFFEATTLKRVPRMGWAMRGVPHVESVADHSHAMAVVTLALSDVLNASGTLTRPLDTGKAVTIALLHDLAEARLTDLRAMLAVLPSAEGWTALWREFEDASTPEGRLVRDADKIEMMVQCLRYELAGARTLDEFWLVMDRHEWYYALSADLYARLKALRPSSYAGG
jgi:putative hydrolase of HD superfamily